MHFEPLFSTNPPPPILIISHAITIPPLTCLEDETMRKSSKKYVFYNIFKNSTKQIKIFFGAFLKLHKIFSLKKIYFNMFSIQPNTVLCSQKQRSQSLQLQNIDAWPLILSLLRHESLPS